MLFGVKLFLCQCARYLLWKQPSVTSCTKKAFHSSLGWPWYAFIADPYFLLSLIGLKFMHLRWCIKIFNLQSKSLRLSFMTFLSQNDKVQWFWYLNINQYYLACIVIATGASLCEKAGVGIFSPLPVFSFMASEFHSHLGNWAWWLPYLLENRLNTNIGWPISF